MGEKMMEYFEIGVHKGTKIQEIKDLLGTEDVEKIDKEFYTKLIIKAHQEAHECNSSKEVHDWIDWFKKQVKQ